MPPKDKKKDAPPPGWNFSPVELVLVFIIILTLISTLLPLFWNYLSSGEISFFGFKLAGFLGFLKNNIIFFKALGLSIAGVSAIGTFVLNKSSNLLAQAERAKIYPNLTSVTTNLEAVPIIDPTKQKWQKIVEHSNSTDSALWRMAIIEADIILDSLLEKLHLPGETMGEKLKVVEKSDFNTIEYAWEAHKVRNMIAHEGSDFLLNQREVRRVISLYEAVFKEFHII